MEERARWSVAAAVVLVVPAMLFVGANILKYGLRVDVISDVLGPFAEPSAGLAEAVVTGLVLIGPVVALALVLAPIVRLQLGRSHRTVEATLSFRLRWVNIAVAVVAIALLAVVSAYVVVENADCWFGDAISC